MDQGTVRGSKRHTWLPANDDHGQPGEECAVQQKAYSQIDENFAFTVRMSEKEVQLHQGNAGSNSGKHIEQRISRKQAE
jgi:hypothetical protein